MILFPASLEDKYRWSHNDSLDDGDNDEFTSSSADDEEWKNATQEQLLEGSCNVQIPFQ